VQFECTLLEACSARAAVWQDQEVSGNFLLEEMYPWDHYKVKAILMQG